MISFAIFSFCLVLLFVAWQLIRMGECVIATIQDLNAALDTQTTAINTLAAAVAAGGTAIDLQPSIDHVTANTAAVDAITASITPPPAP